MRQLLAKLARARPMAAGDKRHFVGEYLAGVSPSVWTEDAHAALVRPLAEADQLQRSLGGFVLLVGAQSRIGSRTYQEPQTQTTIEAYQAALHRQKLD